MTTLRLLAMHRGVMMFDRGGSILGRPFQAQSLSFRRIDRVSSVGDYGSSRWASSHSQILAGAPSQKAATNTKRQGKTKDPIGSRGVPAKIREEEKVQTSAKGEGSGKMKDVPKNRAKKSTFERKEEDASQGAAMAGRAKKGENHSNPTEKKEEKPAMAKAAISVKGDESSETKKGVPKKGQARKLTERKEGNESQEISVKGRPMKGTRLTKKAREEKGSDKEGKLTPVRRQEGGKVLTKSGKPTKREEGKRGEEVPTSQGKTFIGAIRKEDDEKEEATAKGISPVEFAAENVFSSDVINAVLVDKAHPERPLGIQVPALYIWNRKLRQGLMNKDRVIKQKLITQAQHLDEFREVEPVPPETGNGGQKE